MKRISNDNKRRSQSSKKISPIIVFRVISLIIILICLFKLFEWSNENYKNKKLITEIRSQISIDSQENNSTSGSSNTESIENEQFIDFAKLKELNLETVAWIQINNTDINFPVVKTNNNDYYINHNFNKEYNSAGWIFADYRNIVDGTDDNTIIYGHNRRDGSMFSTLNNVLEESWYTSAENQIVTVYIPEKKLQYQVFSIYKIKDSEFDIITNFTSSEEYQNYLDTAITTSIYDFNVDVNNSDKILTVYTCANNNKYRIILHGKLINE